MSLWSRQLPQVDKLNRSDTNNNSSSSEVPVYQRRRAKRKQPILEVVVTGDHFFFMCKTKRKTQRKNTALCESHSYHFLT